MSAEERHEALPEIDFATFALSLGTSVLMYLGQSPKGQEQLPMDLAMAKQTIDIIAMLQVKTKGNLDQAEAILVDQLLYDLRIKYCDAQNAANKLRD